jgi:hypothetical protein
MTLKSKRKQKVRITKTLTIVGSFGIWEERSREIKKNEELEPRISPIRSLKRGRLEPYCHVQGV